MKKLLLLILTIFLSAIKIYSASGSIVTLTITPGTFCAGTNVTVPFSTTFVGFGVGNKFIAQLSDPSGGFTSGVTQIGSVTTVTPITAHIPVTTAGSSRYRIRVISTNPSITGSDNSKNLICFAAPTVSLTADQNTVCQGGELTFEASGIDAEAFVWSPAGLFPDQTISDSIQHAVFDSAATHLISVQASNHRGCSSTASINITALELPGVDLGSDKNVCISAPIILQTDNQAASYEWSPAELLYSTTGGSVTANVSAIGSYTFNVVAISSNGCISTDEIQISISSSITANAGEDAIYCANKAGGIQLEASGGSEYVWSTMAGVLISTMQNITVEPAITSNYVLTASGGICPSSNDTVTVFVKEPPVLSALPSTEVSTCPGCAITLTVIGADSIVWDPHPSLNTTMGATVEATPTTTTIYTATGISNVGCSSSVNITVNMQSTGILDSKSTLNSFDLFPNPFINSATINITLNSKAVVSLEITNILGQHVKTLVSSELEKGTYSYSINELLPAESVYSVKLKINDSLFIKKLIKLNQ